MTQQDDDGDGDGGNEIMAATRAANHHRDAAKHTPEPSTPKHWPLTTIGVGVTIGSAAVAAALLYANRARKK